MMAKKKATTRRKTTKKKTPRSSSTTRRTTKLKPARYEYKIVHLPMEAEELMASQTDLDAKRRYDAVLEKLLNEYGEQGWRPRFPNLDAVIFERVKS